MSEKPRLLDLYCCEGGATRGYQLAGFHVTGVDIRPQPRYIGDTFVQDDAIAYVLAHGHEFDAIHASPPCQRYSCETPMAYRENHPDLIAPTCEAIKTTSKPYVIENVPSARKLLSNPIMLCGSGLGLQVFRHRYFELGGFDILMLPMCEHNFKPVYLTGSTGSSKSTKGTRKDFSVADKRRASGIDWMTTEGLDEAIPPAFTEWIGKYLIEALAITA